jgi:hypothetical protein
VGGIGPRFEPLETAIQQTDALTTQQRASPILLHGQVTHFSNLMQGGGPTPGCNIKTTFVVVFYSCSVVQGEERHPGEEQRGPLPPDQERGHREVSLKNN